MRSIHSLTRCLSRPPGIQRLRNLAGRIFARAEFLEQLTARMLGPTAAGAPGAVEILSDRELEVFRRLGEGQTTRFIAEELNLSVKTVQAYCARIKEKWRLADGAELVRAAVRWVEQQQRRL